MTNDCDCTITRVLVVHPSVLRPTPGKGGTSRAQRCVPTNSVGRIWGEGRFAKEREPLEAVEAGEMASILQRFPLLRTIIPGQ